MICPSTGVQILSPTSSSPLAIPIKKGEKTLRGSLHSVRGSISSDLEKLVYWLSVYLGLLFASITVVFTIFLFKTLVQCALNCFNLYSIYLCLSLCFCSIFFLLLDIANMSWVLHTCALSRIVPRYIYFVYFALVVWLDMQVIFNECFFSTCPDEHFSVICSLESFFNDCHCMIKICLHV